MLLKLMSRNAYPNLTKKHRFREEFFSTSEFLIDLQAKVIFAEKGRRDIIGQYISFCVVVKEQFLLHNDKKKAIQEAIRICIENDDLAEYLMQHRKEVEDIMFTLLTQEEATESYGYLQRMEGREEGRSEELFGLVKDGILTSDIAAKRLNISVAEFEKLYNEWNETK